MRLAIYGTGGSGKELYERILEVDELKNQWDDYLFIDDTKECGEYYGCKMMSFDEFSSQYKINDTKVVIAVGEPKYRKILFDKVEQNGFEFATIIDPTAKISRTVKLGRGVVVKDDVSISSNAIIKDNCYLNGMALIGHDVVLGEHCQVSSYAAVAGKAVIGSECYIGMCSCIRDEINIGSRSIISMGAVVLKDVKEARVVMGNPAREIAENKDGMVFR